MISIPRNKFLIMSTKLPFT